MRTVVFLGLIAIANSISEPTNLTNADLFAVVFIAAVAMDIIEFWHKVEISKDKSKQTKNGDNTKH